MSNPTSKPVIFLAFANDRDDTVGYLRNLPDEARRLRDVLEPAEQAGLCEVIVRSNSTAGDIFKVFQDPRFRNRIAIFHYGGHANGYQLLLESAAGESDAGGLAAFLAQQQGLQLVFLNGCSTQPQTQGLLDANISAVISTSRAIDDQVATDFAHQFYQGLAGRATIRTAYNEGAAASRTAKGSDTRALYFGSAQDPQSRLEADRWPWNLYLRDGSEQAELWNLPDAVNDPLFGLPPLPELDLPESPYRNLNWFTRKHAEVFFGRGHQIRELYERLTAPRTAPIIMFYGQSGVGKSSILDAGLMPRLERDFEVRYLRRTESGLLDTLQLAFLPEASGLPVETAWRVKEEQTGKPLIVILDQVEELYTRPIADLPNELDDLLKAIQATFVATNQRPQGKLVLGFRKEWLAELEAEMVKYELPRSKVFLERLDRRGIIEVVLGPTQSKRLRERFGLTVEDGLAEIIADDLLADRGSAISTTLQILLSKMWTKATEANYEQPRFSHDLYHELQRDGILLRDFLDQQLKAFHSQLPGPADSGLLLDVLALHTTHLGTSNQCSKEHLAEQYAHVSDVLPSLLRQCQALYLLTEAAGVQKESTKTTRLAHDTLAPLVRERFDVSDKPGQRARRILDNRSVDWEDNREGTPLDEADLKVVEQGVVGTRALNATERRLLESSRELQRRLQRNRTTLKLVGAASVVLIAALAVFGWWARGLANERAKELDKVNEGLQTTNEKLEKKTNEATVAAELADVRRLAAQSEANRDHPQRSTLLALESLNKAEVRQLAVNEAEMSLRDSVAHATGVPLGGHEYIWDVAFTHDSRFLVTAGGPDIAQIWNIEKRATVPDYVLRGHKYHITTLAISPNDKWIATGGNDNTARLWPLTESGVPGIAIVLDKHTGSTNDLAFSPDSQWLATASSDNTVRVWNVNDPAPAGVVLQGHTAHLKKVAFDRTGRWLASAGFDKTIRLWDMDKVRSSLGKINAARAMNADVELSGHHDSVDDLAFTSDGRWLISSSDDKTVRIWDLNDPQPDKAVIILRGHEDQIADIAVSADDYWLATCCFGGPIRVWNISDLVGGGAKEVDRPSISLPHGSGALRLAFHPQDQLLLSAGQSVAHLWDLRATDPNQSRVTLTGQESNIECVGFSPDGNWFATAGLNSTRLRRVAVPDSTPSRLRLRGHDGEVSAVAWSPDDRWLASAGWDHKIHLWDLANAQSLSPPKVLADHDGIVEHLGFSPDSRWLASASRDKKALLWDLRTGAPQSSTELTGHTRSLWALLISPDSKWLVTSGDDGVPRIWDLKADDPTRSFTSLSGHKRNTRADKMALSGDSRWLVTAGYFDNARLWDLHDGNPSQSAVRFPDVDGEINAVAISPDNRYIALATTKDVALVWSFPVNGRWETPTVLEGHRYDVEDVAFSTDGRWLATGSADLTARLWPLDSPRRFRESIILGGHENKVKLVTFGPNGRWLVTSGDFSGLRLWDLQTPNPSQTVVDLRGPAGSVRTVAFSHNGRWIAAGDQSGAVHVWTLQPDELKRDAKRAAGRNFSRIEWDTFFPDEPYRKTFEDLDVSEHLWVKD